MLSLRNFLSFGFLLAVVVTSASAQLRTEWRQSYLRCGGTDVRALAECYEATPYCITETLTFMRTGRRTIVGLHPHHEPHDVQKTPLPVLAYTASSWACLRARAGGGHYVSVTLTRTDGGTCRDCDFEQLYQLDGRLIASRLKFDERGRPREDAGAGAFMRRLVGDVQPGALAAIYARK